MVLHITLIIIYTLTTTMDYIQPFGIVLAVFIEIQVPSKEMDRMIIFVRQEKYQKSWTSIKHSLTPCQNIL